MLKNLLAGVCVLAVGAAPAPSSRESTGPIVTFNDDGGWCWFQDERAIVHDGKLIVGSVAAGFRDAARRGNIEAVTYDLASGRTTHSVLHEHLVHGSEELYDDHNAPAFVARPDGHIVAVYSKHGPENVFYHRISARPNDSADWRPVKAFAPSETSRITYSNLLWLAGENDGKGRLYNFFRGLDNSWKPSYSFSDDGGETWSSGGIAIDVPGEVRHRPYVKYVSNGVDTIHLFYTEAHPHRYDNGTYHVFYRNGDLHASDGNVLRSLSEGLKDPSEGTRIFAGDAENVAWVSDIHLDRDGRPYVGYSVHKRTPGQSAEQLGQDHRYRYARWTGREWMDYEIAYAGTRLYSGEDHYTGLIALDPEDPDRVYISTDAHPDTGEPLISEADGKRHYEIFRGVSRDKGATWKWEPVTRNSTVDNIRPIVPPGAGNRSIVLWLRGTYRTYTDYELEVVGEIR